MTVLTVTAAFVGNESKGEGFRRRTNDAPWTLHFHIMPLNGVNLIHVRNAYGEQWKYYDTLTEFNLDWKTV